MYNTSRATRCIGNAGSVGNVLTLEEDSSGNPNPPSRPVTLDDDYDDDDDDGDDDDDPMGTPFTPSPLSFSSLQKPNIIPENFGHVPFKET